VRVVLDTGVVLSSLVFPAGRLAWLPGLWKSGAVTPLASLDNARELIRALGYPKFSLSRDEVSILLSGYLPWTQTVEVPDIEAMKLPACRDRADQKFLELAVAGTADALVTSDRDLLELAGKTAFAILTPSRLRTRLST
jgi:putative PIN family toxin of toxin-antitoxin system